MKGKEEVKMGDGAWSAGGYEIDYDEYDYNVNLGSLFKQPKTARNYKSVIFTSGKAEMKCHCGCVYTARVADLKRGWGISCSKRCAAIRRDYGRSPAKFIKCV